MSKIYPVRMVVPGWDVFSTLDILYELPDGSTAMYQHHLRDQDSAGVIHFINDSEPETITLRDPKIKNINLGFVQFGIGSRSESLVERLNLHRGYKF